MGHWYTKQGQPAHFQPDGKGTTLRHARAQGLVPSVTTVLDVVDKPGLTNYLINQHLKAAWESQADPSYGVTYDEWCKDIRQTASRHANDARDRGLEIHNALEQYYKGEVVDIAMNPFVDAVRETLSHVYDIERGNCTPERSFATELYGGCVDLVADGQINPWDKPIILDFKYKTDGWGTKKDGLPKKIWFDAHVAQLAAYAHGLGLETAVVANVFIGPKAEVYIHEWTPSEIEYGYQYFVDCLRLWRRKNKL